MCLYAYPPVVARQWLSKNITTAMNTHTIIEELLDTSFSMQSMSYQSKVGDFFFPELLVFELDIEIRCAVRNCLNRVRSRLKMLGSYFQSWMKSENQ
jgi:hypothetical protein